MKMVEGIARDRQAQRSAATRVSATYDGNAEMIPAARDFVSGYLARVQAEHGLPVAARTVQIAQLVVSELVTNVVKYAPGPCLLDLEITDDDLEVTVWDTRATMPAPAAPDAERVGRHGMEIVLTLCRHFEISQHAGGKRIRARIALD